MTKWKLANKDKVLKLDTFVLYNNQRVHATFNDGSALIIHQKGDCFTYFYPEGTKARHFIAFSPTKDMIKEKLIAVLTKIKNYSDPILAGTDVFEGSIETKSSKINKFYWKFGPETKPNFHKSGAISYSSLHSNCKLKMHPNRFIFSVEYLQLLPDKTTDWVPVKRSDNKAERMMKLWYQYARVKQYYSIHQFPK